MIERERARSLNLHQRIPIRIDSIRRSSTPAEKQGPYQGRTLWEPATSISLLQCFGNLNLLINLTTRTTPRYDSQQRRHAPSCSTQPGCAFRISAMISLRIRQCSERICLCIRQRARIRPQNGHTRTATELDTLGCDFIFWNTPLLVAGGSLVCLRGESDRFRRVAFLKPRFRREPPSEDL